MEASCSSIAASKPVELGFVEKRAAWKLRSKFFPSKVGGKPAWLNLKDLPAVSELYCPNCNKPCVFLLQVYAPYDTEESFHRTLFIFMCKDGKCYKRNSNKNFVILRSQLPRKNGFYSFEPPVENEKDSNTPSTQENVSLCEVCGCRGTLTCSQCKSESYCTSEHQRIDWRDGHKNACNSDSLENAKCAKKKKNSFLLPEFDLVMDTEDLPPEVPEKSDQEKMREYSEFMRGPMAPADNDSIAVGEIESVTKKKDKVFRKFQKRVNYEPEQVLRYDRHGEPLWVSTENIPLVADIPQCKCGARRLFEFQVMPQLLNYLSMDDTGDSVDWGTLIIYTCANSCSVANSAYVPEFLWKQDFSE